MNLEVFPIEILINIFKFLDNNQLRYLVQLSCIKFRMIYIKYYRLIKSIKIYNYNNVIENKYYIKYAYVLFNNILNNNYKSELEELVLYNCNFLTPKYIMNIISNPKCFKVKILNLSKLSCISSKYIEVIYDNYTILNILNIDLSGFSKELIHYKKEINYYIFNNNKWWENEENNYIINLIINLTNIQLLYLPNPYDIKLKREIDFYRGEFKLPPIELI